MSDDCWIRTVGYGLGRDIRCIAPKMSATPSPAAQTSAAIRMIFGLRVKHMCPPYWRFSNFPLKRTRIEQLADVLAVLKIGSKVQAACAVKVC